MKLYMIYSFLFISSCASSNVLDLNKRKDTNKTLSQKIKCDYKEISASNYISIKLSIDKDDIPKLTPFSEKKITHICFWSSAENTIFLGCQEIDNYEYSHGINKTYDNLKNNVRSIVFSFGSKQMIESLNFHKVNIGDALNHGHHIGFDNYLYYANKNTCRISIPGKKRNIQC